MNTCTGPHLRSKAFSLIELLVVIAIIGILASILLPVIHTMLTKAKIKKARMEMSAIQQAIQQYHSTYGHYPISTTGRISVSAPSFPAPGEDFTFGGTLTDQNGNPASVNAAGIVADRAHPALETTDRQPG